MLKVYNMKKYLFILALIFSAKGISQEVVKAAGVKLDTLTTAQLNAARNANKAWGTLFYDIEKKKFQTYDVVLGAWVDAFGDGSGGNDFTGDYNDLFNLPPLDFLPLAGGTLTGDLTARNIVPTTDNTYDIGSQSTAFRKTYTYGNILRSSLSTPFDWSISPTGTDNALVFGRETVTGSNSFTTAYTLNRSGTALDNTDLTPKSYVDALLADDQQLSVSNDTLFLEDGGFIDLSAYLDNTDGQTVSDFSLFGNILSITLSGGNTRTIDLSSLDSGTDDQTIETFSITGDILSLGLEGDGEADKTVDLSPYNQDLSGYALDSEVVKLTGNQTIGGTKTFTSDIISNNIRLQGSLSSSLTINNSDYKHIRLIKDNDSDTLEIGLSSGDARFKVFQNSGFNFFVDNNSTPSFKILSDETINIPSLSGNGTGIVAVDNSGNLSYSAGGGTGTDDQTLSEVLAQGAIADSPITVDSNESYNLGAPSLRWNNVYTAKVHAKELWYTPTDDVPSTPVEGQSYADDSENRPKYYDGTSFKAFLLEGDAAGGGTDDQTASEVSYDNSTSGLPATDVQGAIDEISNTPYAPYQNLTSTTFSPDYDTDNKDHIYLKNTSEITVDEPVNFVDKSGFSVEQDSTGPIKFDFKDIKGRYLQTTEEGALAIVVKEGSDWRIKCAKCEEYETNPLVNSDFWANSTSIVSADTTDGTDVTEWSNTAQASPDAVPGNAPEYFNGSTGPQVSFTSGNNDYLTLGSTIDYTPQTDTGYIVLRIGDTAPAAGTIFSQAASTSGNRKFQVWVNGGVLKATFGGTLSDVGTTVAANNLIIINIKGSTIDVYVDGVKEVTDGTVGSGNDAADLNIGSRTNGSNLMSGDLDLVAIKIGVSAELTQQEIDKIESLYQIN